MRLGIIFVGAQACSSTLKRAFCFCTVNIIKEENSSYTEKFSKLLVKIIANCHEKVCKVKIINDVGQS